MAVIKSVNVGRPAPNPYKSVRSTGIGKQPSSVPVEVRDPGLRRGGLGSGIVGDFVGDRHHHGGSDQAVYAFAREDLDDWQSRLHRELTDGFFGENLTTLDLDVNNALIGERWLVGDTVVLQVTCPRMPCSTFRGWMGEKSWLRMFTADARPGAYLRVIEPGAISAGDAVEVAHRPDHAVSVALAFRAVTTSHDLRPKLLAAGEDLIDELRSLATAMPTIAPE